MVDRQDIEEIAAERGDTLPRYERDVNPDYPKWVAACSCGFAASSFNEGETQLIRSVGEKHAQSCRTNGSTELLKYTSEDDDPETLDTLVGEGVA